MDQWPGIVEPYKAVEVQAFCVQNKEWQLWREAMKGKPTSVKLDLLYHWYVTHLIGTERRIPRVAKVQIDNYINALKRGGLLTPDLKVKR
jgi:hypothetical protein